MAYLVGMIDIDLDAARLKLFLATYDRRQAEKEGHPNLGRLAVLLHAADCSRESAKAGKSWPEALDENFTRWDDGLFCLAPVRRFVRYLSKQINPK